MKVFISWSGERSRHVAEALRVWLPRVMQTVRPWMSDADISAGSRWLAEVSSVLDETSIGIICVTHENLSSPWLHFEAGALSKALDQSRVCPVGLNLKPGQISGPLSQFQAVTLDESGMLRVLGTLNKLMDGRALPEAELTEIFAVWWPSLAAKLEAIPDAPTPTPARATEDQLEELLQIAREQLRRENLRLEASKLKDESIDEMIKLMERSTSALEPIKNALGGLRSNFMSSMKELQRVTDGGGLDSKAAMALIGMLGAQFPALPDVEIDTNALAEMAEFVKRVQVESKSLTNDLLTKPESTEPPSGA
jgi:hypothetical protein